MTDWLPIASAPKDGTLILVYAAGDDGKIPDMVVLGWSTRDQSWYLPDGADNPLWETPTDWKPLPKPPTTSAP